MLTQIPCGTSYSISLPRLTDTPDCRTPVESPHLEMVLLAQEAIFQAEPMHQTCTTLTSNSMFSKLICTTKDSTEQQSTQNSTTVIFSLRHQDDQKWTRKAHTIQQT